jgi:hypothetical protein
MRVSTTKLRAVMMLAAVMLLVGTPTAPAQNPNIGKLYSAWIQLSLRGLPQQEIESLLEYAANPNDLEHVRRRLRLTVISKLELKRLGQIYRAARDKDDLNVVARQIQTELRFAGLENDIDVRMQIKDRFGIPMDQF